MNFDPPDQSCRGKMNFVRFVVGTNGGDPRYQTGVVVEMRILRESGVLSEYERIQSEEIVEWLNLALPVPPFQTANWPLNAISWFKPSAQDFIAKFRELILILEEHGKFTRMLRTTDPGLIRYEDEFQVVASSLKY